MMLTRIHFTKGADVLCIKREKNFISVTGTYSGEPVNFLVPLDLSGLIGDCLSRMGTEVDFLGLRSHLE